MTEKIEIVEQLGEKGILLPGLLGKALQANDRIKLRFSLLQEAIAQARNPRQNPPTFTAERHAAGLDDTLFDSTISGARALTGNEALVPGLERLAVGFAHGSRRHARSHRDCRSCLRAIVFESSDNVEQVDSDAG